MVLTSAVVVLIERSQNTLRQVRVSILTPGPGDVEEVVVGWIMLYLGNTWNQGALWVEVKLVEVLAPSLCLVALSITTGHVHCFSEDVSGIGSTRPPEAGLKELFFRGHNVMADGCLHVSASRLLH